MRRYLRFVPPALLLAVVAEMAVFIGVGRAVGFGTAVLLVFAASLVGLVLLRREGMRAWRGFRTSVESRQPPGRQVTDGLVGLAGALLLAIPGLLSGVVGLVLLVPPVRRLVRSGVQRATERRVSSMVAGDLFGPRTVRVRRVSRRRRRRSTVMWWPRRWSTSGRAIEGEIVEPRRP